MKIFFSTLAAILVAAAIIGLVLYGYNVRKNAVEQDETTRQIILQGELSNAETEWGQKVGPRLDPMAEQLSARMREIRDASEAGKPIPPSRWQVTLTMTLYMQDGSTLPLGANVELLSQDGANAHIRYASREFIVPNSAVTQSK